MQKQHPHKAIKVVTYVFVFCFALAIVVPDYLSTGLFMDGLIYGTISRNMAEGIGSFWHPTMSDTLFNPFREHPPLQLYLTSLLFKVFPDYGFLIEKISGVILYVLSVFLTFKIWRISSETRDNRDDWLLLTFLILPPSIAFIYARNMLEIGLTISVLVSVLLAFKILSTNGVKRFLFLFLMACCIVAGFLCKGPVALFPLAFFLFYALTQNEYHWGKFISDTLILTVFLVLCALLFYFYEPSHEYLKDYLPRMIGGAVEGQATVLNVDVLLFLFNETIGIVGLGFAFVLINKFVLKKKYNTNQSKGLLFLFIALSASLPLLLSSRQVPYYIAPSYYFFALSGCFFFSDAMKNVVFNPQWKTANLVVWGAISLVVFVFGLRLSLKSYRTTRLEDERKDLKVLMQTFKPHESFNVRRQDWRFSQAIHPLFYRWAYLNFDPKDENKHDYLIGKQGEDYGLSPDEYQEVTHEFGLDYFSLYRYKRN